MSNLSQEKEALFTIIIIASLIFFVLSVVMISFIILYQRKKLKHIQEKETLKVQYEQEILKSQIEVQNQTLQNIGRELHDNIGQLLTVAKINIGLVDANLEGKEIGEAQENIQQVGFMLNQIIDEVRNLSKSLDENFVQEFGLQQSTTHELRRIRKTKKIEIELLTEGNPYKLDFQKEIILFRVMQEVLNNAMKHSYAKQLLIIFNYETTFLELIIQDNGKGFDVENTLKQKEINQSGVGLRNIQKRTTLIGGECKIISELNNGTKISIKIPV